MVTLLRASCAFLLVWLGAAGARAAEPVSFPGSSWSGTGVIAANVKGAGKVMGEIAFDLDFGPQADPALADDQFLLVLDDGMETLEVTGTWAVDEKGRLLLALDVNALAAELSDLVLHVCADVLGLGSQCDLIPLLDVVLDPAKQKLKLKGKSKDGLENLKAKGKFPFAFFLDGEPVGRVSIGFKANRDVTRD
jgi:hypothetical protein